eukprot:7132005-Ditylum_brightwellii.AAC.1
MGMGIQIWPAFALLQESKFLLPELRLTEKEEAGDDDNENVRVRIKDLSHLLNDGLYAEDNLNALMNALPPAITSHFGEISWAAGEVGFGWWSTCIYEPYLTVGGA